MREAIKVAVTIFCLMTVAVVGRLHAATMGSEALEQAVSQFLTEKNLQAGRETVTVTGITLDSRLRLEQCVHPPEGFLPVGGKIMGRVSVGLRCREPLPWTIYLQARVEWIMPVVVANRPLMRGEIVGSNDLTIEQRDVAGMSSGFYSNIDEVVGMVASRSLAAAMPLGPGLLKPPTLIRRGERVTIMAVAGALEVRMEGEALQDGSKGAMIRVRNLSSRQEVEGEVVSAGLVRVRM